MEERKEAKEMYRKFGGKRFKERGDFSNLKLAHRRQNKLKKKGFNVRIHKGFKRYHVYARKKGT